MYLAITGSSDVRSITFRGFCKKSPAWFPANFKKIRKDLQKFSKNSGQIIEFSGKSGMQLSGILKKKTVRFLNFSKHRCPWGSVYQHHLMWHLFSKEIPGPFLFNLVTITFTPLLFRNDNPSPAEDPDHLGRVLHREPDPGALVIQRGDEDPVTVGAAGVERIPCGEIAASPDAPFPVGKRRLFNINVIDTGIRDLFACQERKIVPEECYIVI
jgi:hypothetical protein